MVEKEMHVCKRPNCLPTMPYELPIHSFIQTNAFIQTNV